MPAPPLVVSYSISTSNHNYNSKVLSKESVVSYSISTSNHNCLEQNHRQTQLYLIPFLHQTTTNRRQTQNNGALYLIPFLHQTTTICYIVYYLCGCILFHFYIKPQLCGRESSLVICCILFHFYIKPQPIAHKTLFSSTLSPKSHSHFQRNAVV